MTAQNLLQTAKTNTNVEESNTQKHLIVTRCLFDDELHIIKWFSYKEVLNSIKPFVHKVYAVSLSDIKNSSIQNCPHWKIERKFPNIRTHNCLGHLFSDTKAIKETNMELLNFLVVSTILAILLSNSMPARSQEAGAWIIRLAG